MRIHAHALSSGGSKRCKFRLEFPILVEEILRPVASHPVFEDPQVSGIAAHVIDRHLMRAPRALDGLAIDFLWSRPAFWRAQDHQWPAWALDLLLPPRTLLNCANVFEHAVESRGHELMH